MVLHKEHQPNFQHQQQSREDHRERQLLIKVFVIAIALTLLVFHSIVFLFDVDPVQANPIVFIRHLFPNYVARGDKVILLWTDFFSDSQWNDHFSRNQGPWVHLQSGQRCYFTTNRNFQASAEAVVFHGRDLRLDDIPKKRNFKSRWIYYLLESPMQSGVNSEEEWNILNSQMQFNWTMSYSKLADIYSPYGRIRSVSHLNRGHLREKINSFVKSFSERPKDAVWIVSNCFTASMREQIVAQLRHQNLTIDIWGRCGQLGEPVDLWKTNGEEAFFSRYRFYLALENNLCDEYVTEKAFHGFYVNYLAGAIPIVYGNGHENIFPNGSYIEVNKFLDDLSQLSALMKNLSKPGSDIRSFYQWQLNVNPLYEKGYEIDASSSDIFINDNYKRQGWQNLCTKLWHINEHGAVSMRPRVQDLLGKCYTPNVSVSPIHKSFT